MADLVTPDQILFDITDIFGKQVRTTKAYWTRIKTEKHQELNSEASRTKLRSNRCY